MHVVFNASVESLLLYGSETWTLGQQSKHRLDGCYTRMLRQALNIDPATRMTNEDLYLELPKLSKKIQSRRLGLAGHCHRHEELAVQRLVLWEPTHGTRRRGRQQLTYVDNLKRDTGLRTVGEIGTCMKEREVWRSIISRETHST